MIVYSTENGVLEQQVLRTANLLIFESWSWILKTFHQLLYSYLLHDITGAYMLDIQYIELQILLCKCYLYVQN